jgi:hypothetical protein
VLEINSGVSGLPNSDWKKHSSVIQQGNSFTSAEGYATNKSLVSKHTEWEVHLGFIPSATLPHTRIGPHLGSQLFAIGYYLG